jgi:NTP pyrophosphatase (non-canonical NTP hydrolase)
MTDMKIIQKKVKNWIAKKGFEWSVYAEYCHLVEEVGELGEAIVVQQGERKPGKGSDALADHSNVDEEIGDSLFTLIVLSNMLNLDIERCFDNTIKRYNQKVEKRQAIKP